MLEYATTHDDPTGVFSHWLVDGADRDNTDHGRLYVRIDDALEVSLYADAARTDLVAMVEDNQVIEQNDSGLSGRVRVTNATPLLASVDLFYADDADLAALQGGVAGFLTEGVFNNRPGFAEPLARAKRVVDALLNARLPRGWRADDLQPLAHTTACYALLFIYDHLSTHVDDAAAERARHWRHEARRALPSLQLLINGASCAPFQPRVLRA